MIPYNIHPTTLAPIPTMGHLLLRRQPRNITILPEIRQFRPPGQKFNRGEIELANGTVGLIDIHSERPLVDPYPDHYRSRPHYIWHWL